MRLFACVLALCCAAAVARPAYWQLWTSRQTGRAVCAQVSPGTGWAWQSGPYRDSHCTVRVQNPAESASARFRM